MDKPEYQEKKRKLGGNGQLAMLASPFQDFKCPSI